MSREFLGLMAVVLALAWACGSRGPGPAGSASTSTSTGTSTDTHAPETRREQPVAAPQRERICPPAPALGDTPVPVTSNFGGARCPAGVCPSYYACGCDSAGRPVFLEHTYSGVPRDRYWILYDQAGNRSETRRDYEADGRIDARFTYAHAPADEDSLGCVTETRDEDLDGVAENICTYADACAGNLVDCRPLACRPAQHTPAGTPCAPATCPPGASCSCDQRGRVLEALDNLDADPVPEARTAYWYDDERNQGHEDKPDRQTRYLRGKRVSEIVSSYDSAGRLVVEAMDTDGDGVADREVRRTYGETADWLTLETWTRGVLTERRTRTYDSEHRLLTERYQIPGSYDTTVRYFPGADEDVQQPVAIESSLMSRARVSCTADDQCVAVQGANCCPCTAGGAGVIVHRKHARAVNRAIARRCGATQICPGVISTDATCRGDLRPACVQGICTMRAR